MGARERRHTRPRAGHAAVDRGRARAARHPRRRRGGPARRLGRRRVGAGRLRPGRRGRAARRIAARRVGGAAVAPARRRASGLWGGAPGGHRRQLRRASREVPIPSAADAPRLGGLLIIGVAVVLMAVARTFRDDKIARIDAVIVGVGAGVVLAAFLWPRAARRRPARAAGSRSGSRPVSSRAFLVGAAVRLAITGASRLAAGRFTIEAVLGDRRRAASSSAPRSSASPSSGFGQVGVGPQRGGVLGPGGGRRAPVGVPHHRARAAARPRPRPRPARPAHAGHGRRSDLRDGPAPARRAGRRAPARRAHGASCSSSWPSGWSWWSARARRRRGARCWCATRRAPSAPAATPQASARSCIEAARELAGDGLPVRGLGRRQRARRDLPHRARGPARADRPQRHRAWTARSSGSSSIGERPVRLARQRRRRGRARADPVPHRAALGLVVSQPRARARRGRREPRHPRHPGRARPRRAGAVRGAAREAQRGAVPAARPPQQRRRAHPRPRRPHPLPDAVGGAGARLPRRRPRRRRLRPGPAPRRRRPRRRPSSSSSCTARPRRSARSTPGCCGPTTR